MRILLQILLIDNRICNWFDSFRMQDDTNAEYVFNKTSVMIHVPCLSFFTRAHYAVARCPSVRQYSVKTFISPPGRTLL